MVVNLLVWSLSPTEILYGFWEGMIEVGMCSFWVGGMHGWQDNRVLVVDVAGTGVRSGFFLRTSGICHMPRNASDKGSGCCYRNKMINCMCAHVGGYHNGDLYKIGFSNRIC